MEVKKVIEKQSYHTVINNKFLEKVLEEFSQTFNWMNVQNEGGLWLTVSDKKSSLLLKTCWDKNKMKILNFIMILFEKARIYFQGNMMHKTPSLKLFWLVREQNIIL